MLRIERSSNGNIIFALSGRIESEGVNELQRLFGLEAVDHHVVLDLRDVTLVDRDGVKFLAHCETTGIKLRNCPAYVRDWIDRLA